MVRIGAWPGPTAELCTPVVVEGLHDLRPGVHDERSMLSDWLTDRATLESTRYARSLIRLERRLRAGGAVLGSIRADLDDMVDRGLAEDPCQPAALKQLADVYLRYVSSLEPRILVRGEPSYLNAPGNPERIRALLLGGLRAVVLWRQVGGNRINLLFGRRALRETVEALLSDPEAGEERPVS